MTRPSAHGPLPYVSRGGLKLEHALKAFALDVRGLRCADFGCNVGGFTDCLLKHGAAHVTAVDTGYGTLAWTLRNDPRVKVKERTNALHAPAPIETERVDLVVIDMGWTPQDKCIPAALKWINATGRIVTLIKPHYELLSSEKHLLTLGVLPEAEAERVTRRTIERFGEMGANIINWVKSPVEGGAGKGNASGNTEWLALLTSTAADGPAPLN